MIVHGNLNLKPKLVPTAIDAEFRLASFREVFLKTADLLLRYLNFGGEDGFQCLDKSNILTMDIVILLLQIISLAKVKGNNILL